MDVCTALRGRLLGRLLIAFLVLSLVSGAVLTMPALVRAQEGEQPAPEKKEGEEDIGPKSKMSANPIVHFFVSIGVVFGIIFAALSVGTLALIIILVMDLRMGEAVSTAFVDEFTGLVNKRQFKQAYEMCKNDNSFLGRVLTAGMGRLQYGIEDAREASMAMVDTVKAKKEQLITYLATIGTLGPLLGLVGTVFGMIIAFKELGREGTTPKTSELARGISTALRLTLFGVGLAVPAIFFHSFFRNRLIAMANDTANVADDLLTQMYHNSKRPAVGADARPPSSASIKA